MYDYLGSRLLGLHRKVKSLLDLPNLGKHGIARRDSEGCIFRTLLHQTF